MSEGKHQHILGPFPDYGGVCTSHQACATGLGADGRRDGAHCADGGRTGAPFHPGRRGHRFPNCCFCFGWRCRWKANACDFVHWGEQSVLGLALEISGSKRYNNEVQIQTAGQYNRPQYLVPATAPSFFPNGSSSSTPHHSPLAKSVSPRKRTTPALVPPTYEDEGVSLK